MSRGDPPGLTGARKKSVPGQGVSLALWLACTISTAFGWGSGARAAVTVTNTVNANYNNEFSQAQAAVSSSTSFSVVTNAPSLVVSASPSATAAWDGDPIYFALTVFNAGDDSAFNISVLDTLPMVVRFGGSATPSADPGWGPTAGLPDRLSWNLPQLDIGQTASIVFAVFGAPPIPAVQAGGNSLSVHYDGYSSFSAPTVVEIWRSAPSGPGNLSAVAGGTSVAVSWTPATAGRDPVSGYLIYRSTGAGVPATLLASTYGSWTTGFTDAVPVPGMNMCYSVVAVDMVGRISAFAGPACTNAELPAVVTPVSPAEPEKPAEPVKKVHLTVVVTDKAGRTVKILLETNVLNPVTSVSVADGREYLRMKSGEGVAITLSDGTVLNWDGLGANGAPVPNGFYTVTVTSVLPSGQVQQAADSVALVREFKNLIDSAVFVPNPAREGVWLSYSLASPYAEMTARIYNIAGELVWKTVASGAGSSFKWDLKNRQGTRVAPGIYIAVLDAADSVTGTRSRKLLRLAVER